MIFDAVRDGLEALANRHGYVTRWNIGPGFVPPEVGEQRDEVVV